MNRRLLIVILFLAFILRLVGLGSFPYFNQDEAGIGYDAYSLALTGKDHWGSTLPLVLRSFGDFKTPLYSYLAIPFVATLGLNEFAVRLPGAIFGVLAVLVTYHLAHELVKLGIFGKLRNRIKPEHFALLTALLLAVSPWHVMLSRGAFEANLTTFFLGFGVFGFLRGLRDSKWMIAAALLFGFNLFTYHSARIVTPLIVLFLLFIFRTKFSKVLPKLKYGFLIIFGVFVLAAVYTFFQGAGVRAQDLTVFKGALNQAAPKRLAMEESGTPAYLARIVQNKYRVAGGKFVNNYFQYYSPKFLITDGVADSSYGMIPGIGVIYWFSAVFLLGFAVYIWRNIRELDKEIWLIVFWLIIAPIPAAFASGVGYAGNRSAGVMPALQISIAIGALYLYSSVKRRFPNGNTKLMVAISLFILTFTVAGFVSRYFGKYRNEFVNSTSYVMKKAVNYASKVEDEYETIYFGRLIGVPHIWVSFYSVVDPEVIQDASGDWLRYEDEGLVYLDQLDLYGFNKYKFGNLFYETRGLEANTLFLGKPEEFPRGVNPIKTIFYPNGEPAIIIVESLVSI